MLAHAREEARAAGHELRELARGLHPAGLAEYGLEPRAGRRWPAAAPLPLQVGALPDRRLPDVRRGHASTTSSARRSPTPSSTPTRPRVRVEVTLHAGPLVVEVSDDGARRRRLGEPAAACAALADRVVGARRPAGGHEPAGRRARACARRSRSRRGARAREPFLEFGHEGDDGRRRAA